MNTGTETHSIARNEQRQVSIHGSRNLFLFRLLVLSTLLPVIYGRKRPRLAFGGHSWGFYISLGCFLGLSGNYIDLAYFGERESVSDLLQIIVVWEYGLG